MMNLKGQLKKAEKTVNVENNKMRERGREEDRDRSNEKREDRGSKKRGTRQRGEKEEKS